MRLKSIGGRARSSKEALPKPSSIPRSVSLLNQQLDCDGNDSIETDSTEPNTPSDGEDGMQEADGVNVIPDSSGERVGVGAEKPPSRNIFGCDFMEIDSLEEETCLKCDEGGQVLFCCEIGCPVGLHEKCIGTETVFDDAGKFYCPYCLYRRALAQTRELRVKAMEAKKALSSFLDAQEVDGDKGKGKDRQTNAEEPDTSVLHGNRNHFDHGNRLDNGVVENQFKRGKEHQQTKGKENIANHDQHREVVNHVKDISPLEDREKVQAEDSREHEDDLHQRDDDYIHQAEPSNACHIEEETAADGLLSLSTKHAQGNAYISGEVPRSNKEQMKPHVEKTTLLSTKGGSEKLIQQRNQVTGQFQNVDSPSKSFTKLSADAEENARNKMKNCNTSKESSYSTEKSYRDHKEKAVAAMKSRQLVESTKQDPIFCGRKHKKLFWTAEEEEMLKKGVHIISSNVKKNISWKKVLEFGAHKFHPSRTPSELKDKWKSMNKGLK